MNSASKKGRFRDAADAINNATVKLKYLQKMAFRNFPNNFTVASLII
jgi:hypothetical protein